MTWLELDHAWINTRPVPLERLLQRGHVHPALLCHGRCAVAMAVSWCSVPSQDVASERRFSSAIFMCRCNCTGYAKRLVLRKPMKLLAIPAGWRLARPSGVSGPGHRTVRGHRPDTRRHGPYTASTCCEPPLTRKCDARRPRVAHSRALARAHARNCAGLGPGCRLGLRPRARARKLTLTSTQEDLMATRRPPSPSQPEIAKEIPRPLSR